MTKHHHDSLLPAARQGEACHETATQHPVMVRINGVFNTVNIHRSDAEIVV